MLELRAQSRLRAAEDDTRWLANVLGIEVFAGARKGYKLFTVSGEDLPYFKAVDKITEAMGTYTNGDTKYEAIQYFLWHQKGRTVFAVPLDSVASSYCIGVRSR